MDNSTLYTHRSYMGPPAPVRSVADLYMGDVVRFSYKSEIKHVFVLDPQYMKKTHGLTLDKIPRDALIQHVIGRMDRTDDPYVLYTSFLKDKIHEYDAYRTYFSKNITNLVRFAYHLDMAQKGATDLDEEQNARGR